MVEIEHSGEVLEIGDESVEFDWPIHQVVELDDRVLVVLDDRGDERPGPRNVYAYDHSGERLWRIEAGDPATQKLRIMDAGEDVYVSDVDHWHWHLDVETGAIEVHREGH